MCRCCAPCKSKSVCLQEADADKRVRSISKLLRPFKYIKHVIFAPVFVFLGIKRHTEMQYMKGIVKAIHNIDPTDDVVKGIMDKLDSTAQLSEAD